MEQRQLNVIGTNMIWLTIWQMFIWEGIVWQIYTLTASMGWGTLLEEGRLWEQKGLWGYVQYWGFFRSIRWPEFFSLVLAMNGKEQEVVCEASDSGTTERGHKVAWLFQDPKEPLLCSSHPPGWVYHPSLSFPHWVPASLWAVSGQLKTAFVWHVSALQAEVMCSFCSASVKYWKQEIFL